MLCALASCDILLGTGNSGVQNPSENSGTGGSQQPSGNGGTGNGGSGTNKPDNTEKEEEIFYDKGIFFDSQAAEDVNPISDDRIFMMNSSMKWVKTQILFVLIKPMQATKGDGSYRTIAFFKYDELYY